MYMKTVDVCFVGAGASNLYAAFRLSRQDDPRKTFVLIERSPARTHCAEGAGRWQTVGIDGGRYPGGAGVGRWYKDVRLKRLVYDVLSTRPGRMPSNFAYSDRVKRRIGAVNDADVGTWIGNIIERLRSAWVVETPPTGRRSMTFRDFATRVLGNKDTYEAFVDAVGYSDYEKQDAFVALNHYGFEDTVASTRNAFFRVDWPRLTSELVKSIGRRRFVFDTPVTSIVKRPDDDLFDVRDANGKVIATARTVVLGVAVPELRKLLPVSVRSTYDVLRCQPFLRVYAHVRIRQSPDWVRAVRTMTIVGRPIQKIIPMSDEKDGVRLYMIAYCDNASTRKVLSGLGQCPRAWETALRDAVGGGGLVVSIERVRAVTHWACGTHYFAPCCTNEATFRSMLATLQRPTSGIVVVGEAVSAHQGWTEGALSSVDAVWPYIA